MGFDRNDRFDRNDQRQEIVYSQKVKAGKRRTYFIDVRSTNKGNDFYVTITESVKRFEDDSFIRSKIFLYKEDFNRFSKGLSDVIEHVKTQLMPDYDYEEFDRRREEDDAEYNKERAERGEREERPSYRPRGGTNDGPRPSYTPKPAFKKENLPLEDNSQLSNDSEIDGDVEGW